MRRRLGLVVAGAVVATGLVPFAVNAQAEPGSTAADTTLEIDSGPIADQVRRQIVGANHRWLHNGLGMWDAANDRPQPRMVDLAERTGLGLVRYPGGTVANLYDWKQAIGPEADRGCQTAAGFVGEPGAPVDSVYGPDENEEFVDEIGARTTIMTNGSGQRAREAANFVEYMNGVVGENKNGGKDWAQVRADNAQDEPYDVEVWEIGNEVYLSNQHYWRDPDPTVGLKQYTFGGTQRQTDQPVGRGCDHRPSAGASDGSADQNFELWYPPAVPGSQTVRVGGSAWDPVDDLAQAGPDDKVYEFDPETGDIVFGDGTHGRVPADGQEIRADYDSGPHPGFVDYYKAMKEVDDSISVCSAWEKPEFVELMGSEHAYDCIGPHLYTNPLRSPDAEQMHDEGMSQLDDVLGELDALTDAMKEQEPIGSPFLEVSEYGSIPRGTADTPENWGGSISTTLQFGSLVVGMVKRSVPLAVSSNLNHENNSVGELFGGAGDPNAAGYPAFLETGRSRALALVSELAGTQPIMNETIGNPMADGGYVALRALATRGTDDTLRLFVVNRARGLNVETDVELPGFVAGSGELTLRTLNGDRLDSVNTRDDLDAIDVQASTKSWSDRTFTHKFPAHSITMIEIAAP